MKAILSHRIYLEVDDALERSICEELTYSIPSYSDPTNPIILRNYIKIRKGLISIPIGRIDLIPTNYDIIDKRIADVIDFPEFTGTLRTSQQDIYDDIEDNALINAKVSYGKTFTGMAIAGKFKHKTLVVVHTLPLMEQWATEVKKVYNIEPGIVGGGKIKTNAPIVIGNVSSLYTRMPEYCKMFGTLIMDEVHHAPSRTFSEVVDKSYAKLKIGLSGTLIRKDGRHVVIPDYFGKKIYQPPAENRLTPIVHSVTTGLMLPQGKSWANSITDLHESPQYRNLLVALLHKYQGMGYKVLLVGDRVASLKYIAEKTDSALIIGETKNRQAQFDSLDNNNRAICSIISIFKEGISYDPLSCIILGSPINNEPMLEQLIGRVQRIHPDKKQPVVVDLRLSGYTVENQYKAREMHYLKQGYQIIHY